LVATGVSGKTVVRQPLRPVVGLHLWPGRGAGAVGDGVVDFPSSNTRYLLFACSAFVVSSAQRASGDWLMTVNGADEKGADGVWSFKSFCRTSQLFYQRSQP
jgi:hypothetical protein